MMTGNGPREIEGFLDGSRGIGMRSDDEEYERGWIAGSAGNDEDEDEEDEDEDEDYDDDDDDYDEDDDDRDDYDDDGDGDDDYF